MEKKKQKRIVLSSNTAFSPYNFRLHVMRALKGWEMKSSGSSAKQVEGWRKTNTAWRK